MNIPVIIVEKRLKFEVKKEIEEGTMPDSDVIEIFNHFNTIHNEKKYLRTNVYKWLGITVVLGIVMAILFSYGNSQVPEDFVGTLSPVLSFVFYAATGLAICTFISFLIFLVAIFKHIPFGANYTVFKDVVEAINRRDTDFFTKNNLGEPSL